MQSAAPRKTLQDLRRWHRPLLGSMCSVDGRCDTKTIDLFRDADHAPEAGVAQGIFHGILVRHQGKRQEEVEERLEEDVDRRVKREHSSNQTQVRMHG